MKTYKILIIAVTAFAFTTSACTSNSSNAQQAGTDSVAEQVDDDVLSPIELKGDGVYADHNILLGDKIADLPPAVKDLYDSYSVSVDSGMDMEDDMTTVTFSLDGEVIFRAMSYDNVKIDWICVSSPNLRFEVNGRYFGVGDMFPEEFKALDDLFWDDVEGGMYTYKDFIIPYDTDKDEIVSVSVGEMPF